MQQNVTNTPTTPTPAPLPSPVIPPSSPNRDRSRREGIKSVLGTILILLIAPVLALGITAYVFQSYEVDGPSMETTLQDQDRLIIWKAGRTWARLTRSEFVPDRGSIVVFVKKGMYDFSSDKEKQLIKRVVGLPGDRVTVKDGKVMVYNDAHPEGFNPDKTLGYGQGADTVTEGTVDVIVGPGEVFVLGDNRDNSLDSRSFGAIPDSDIVGTLSLRILPLSKAQKF